MARYYAERDPRGLEPFYSRHVQAMTEEGLHEKSDIAAELAWRDQQRHFLQQEVNGLIDKQNGGTVQVSQLDVDCAATLREVNRGLLDLLGDAAESNHFPTRVLVTRIAALIARGRGYE